MSWQQEQSITAMGAKLLQTYGQCQQYNSGQQYSSGYSQMIQGRVTSWCIVLHAVHATVQRNTCAATLQQHKVMRTG
jgi:hypothetical protein